MLPPVNQDKAPPPVRPGGSSRKGEVTPPSKGRTPSAPPVLGPKGGTPHTASALERPGWLGGADCSAINTAQDNR